ncbi:cytochrome P450 [Aestuariivivens sediminicola]|uniref:cytochrome P450 n=1 Tax=Aestuariivivens sediminicola TaxID=2913560 RepID=UPI001F56613B|nr:cytochrome P450 [Aestuariivivens sediminicola]
MLEHNTYPKADRLKKELFFGNTRRVLKAPLEFLRQLATSYGPVVNASMAGKKYMIVQHPDYIKHVLVDNNRVYNKTTITKILRIFFGEGLVTNNGAIWAKKRRLIQPAFHKRRLSHILDIINEETTGFLDKLHSLPGGTRLNVTHELLHLNISIVSRSLFSSALKDDMNTMVKVLEELTTFASVWMKSIFKVPLSWPTPANKKFNKNCEIFDSIIYGIIEKRKAYNSDAALPSHDDLLDMLLDYADEDTQNKMNDRQLRDEITTLFMAGHDTTAQTLGWICYEIAKEREINKKISAECHKVLKDGPPRLEDLTKLYYTNQVIKEGLRYYPSIGAILRRPSQDDVIKGIKIKASTNVLINIYGVHHHSDFWEAPEKFDPERFSAELDKERPPFVYLPFGGGPRLCIGSSFAIMVMQVVLSRLYGSFEFSVPDGYLPEIEPNIIIKAKEGIHLILHKI